MPLNGTLDVTPRLSSVAAMRDLGTEPLVLEKVEVLQAMFEIDSAPMVDLLPPALHPTIPPTVTFVFWRCLEGSLGAFTLAQARVGCRAGARPRGFPIGAWIDSAPAGSALASRWGLSASPADVRLRRAHHQVQGTVPGAVDVVLRDPEAISGSDIQYTANMNLASVDDEPLLVQLDPDYTFQRADRGKPILQAFDAAACGDERITVVYPISASIAICDITLPRIRYVSVPSVSAMQGTRKVG